MVKHKEAKGKGKDWCWFGDRGNNYKSLWNLKTLFFLYFSFPLISLEALHRFFFMPKTEQEAAENWDLQGDLWRKDQQSFSDAVCKRQPCPNPQRGSRRNPGAGEVLSWSMTKQLLISLTGKTALKKHKGQGRERGGTCHGEAKDRLPEEWARIQITQMQNPSVLVNLD